MACTIKGCPFEGCDGGGDHTANLVARPFTPMRNGQGDCDYCMRFVESRVIRIHEKSIRLCVPCLGDLYTALALMPEMHGAHP